MTTNNTSTSIVTPKNEIPSPDTNSGLGSGGAFAVIPFMLYYVGRSIYRRFIRDKVEIAKDRAETDIVQVLQEDNAKLRSAYERVQDERNQAVSQLGKFVAETEAYKAKVGELQDSISKMSQKLEEQTALLQAVLVENSQLKSQVQHLAQINDRLENEVKNLDSIVNRMVSFNDANQKDSQVNQTKTKQTKFSQ